MIATLYVHDKPGAHPMEMTRLCEAEGDTVWSALRNLAEQPEVPRASHGMGSEACDLIHTVKVRP